MSAPTPSASPADQSWIGELATFLGPGCFPATHDHLAVTLITRHAPSHLLWRLSVLPRARQFESLDDLIDELSRRPSSPSGGTVGNLSRAMTSTVGSAPAGKAPGGPRRRGTGRNVGQTGKVGALMSGSDAPIARTGRKVRVAMSCPSSVLEGLLAMLAIEGVFAR